jgi:hypothetical protein
MRLYLSRTGKGSKKIISRTNTGNEIIPFEDGLRE